MTRCKFAPARHDGDPDSEADHSGARVTCRVASLKATVGRHRRERAKVKLVGEEDSDASHGAGEQPLRSPLGPGRRRSRRPGGSEFGSERSGPGPGQSAAVLGAAGPGRPPGEAARHTPPLVL